MRAFGRAGLLCAMIFGLWSLSADPVLGQPSQSTDGATSSNRRLAAGLGGAVGLGATYLALQHGGSTAYCDRSANQDAIGARECYALYAVGGIVGAGIGWLIGGRIGGGRSDADVQARAVELLAVPGTLTSVGVRIRF